MTYTDLMKAIHLLEEKRREVYATEQDSPAWLMLLHARAFLQVQANTALRGE